MSQSPSFTDAIEKKAHLRPPDKRLNRYATPRWREFMRAHVNDGNRSPNELRKALSCSGATMEGWLQGTKLPTADTAFRVGEELAKLGALYVSGPIAVHAAGHYALTLRFLRELALEDGGARLAIALFCMLPEMNNWLAVDNGETSAGNPELLAPPLIAQMNDPHTGKLYRTAWRRVVRGVESMYTDQTPHSMLLAWSSGQRAIDQATGLAEQGLFKEAGQLSWALMEWWARWVDSEVFIEFYDWLRPYALPTPLDDAIAARAYRRR